MTTAVVVVPVVLTVVEGGPFHNEGFLRSDCRTTPKLRNENPELLDFCDFR